MMPRVRMATRVADVSETPLIRYCRWALAVTAACMPLYVVRFRIGPIPTTLLEVLILVTIALYAAGRFQARDWHVQRTSLEIPIALLLIAGIIGIAISPDHVGALGIYRAYFIEPIALFYVAIDLLQTPQQFRVLLLGIAIGATVFALMNLGAWAIALARHQTIATGDAPEALYSSPNAVAMFLEPPFALAAGFALYAGDRRNRLIAAACLVFLLAALLLTLSRAGWLTLAVLAVVAVITIPNRRLKAALLGGALIGGFAVAQIPYIHERLARQLDPTFKDNTFEGRLQIWSDTLHMLRDHPILGAGLRAYTQVMAPYVTGNRIPELYPHNVYLAMWAELGLLGLVAFIVLLGMLLWRGWRAFYRAHDFARPLLWGTSAAFVAIAVHGLFDTPYYKNDLAVEFWILAALEIAAIRAFVTRATGKQ
jgi:putative inorganic carbon (HCO3(-)) transporter